MLLSFHGTMILWSRLHVRFQGIIPDVVEDYTRGMVEKQDSVAGKLSNERGNKKGPRSEPAMQNLTKSQSRGNAGVCTSMLLESITYSPSIKESDCISLNPLISSTFLRFIVVPSDVSVLVEESNS